MKRLTAYCLLCCVITSAHAQYYLRGSIRDEKNNPLPGAGVYLYSARIKYSAGSDGSFGITTALLYDSVMISMDGYESRSLKLKTDQWQNINLKISAEAAFKNRPRLISFTKDDKHTKRYNPYVSDETYFKLVENDFVKTVSFPNTGFSLNVNKAAYSNVRRFINMQSKVPPDAVRVEELVNYFNLGYDPPAGKDEVFNVNTKMADCPWNNKNELLFINVSAKKLNLENKPPGNFVFLIDVSGSMDMQNRLPLLKSAFQLFVKNLRPVDKVSIVTYGGAVGVWLQPTSGDQQAKISRAIELLTAAGDTPGSYAIEVAYKLAVSSFVPNGNNRVILATDGDFNIGQTSEKALDELITKQRSTGVYLTCLGVGMGNFKDSKLQTLAKRGNGNYAYLDDLHEAEKVMVEEITETLYAVADNVFINIDFDPARVASYRLIGFDNKKEAVQDGNSELDGGEIGSGGTTMAIFEIEPAKDMKCELGVLNLKFHDVKDSTGRVQKIFRLISAERAPDDSAHSQLNFAAAVAMYGMKLKESPYINKATWNDVKAAAQAAADGTDYLQNDFIEMIDKTIQIYDPHKKKKDKKKKDKNVRFQ